VKLIDAAQRAGISRYVIVSSVGADADASGDDTFAVYLRAKGRADAALGSSGLDHTIVRPGHLTDDAGTGHVRVGRDGEIPRQDVAATLAAVLHEPRTAGLTFELVGGDVPIDDAVAALGG
jgi:cytosine deaminase